MFLSTFRQKILIKKIDNLVKKGLIDSKIRAKIVKFYMLDDDEQIQALAYLQGSPNSVEWEVKRIDSYKIEKDGMKYAGEYIDVKRANESTKDINELSFVRKISAGEQTQAKTSSELSPLAIIIPALMLILVALAFYFIFN